MANKCELKLYKKILLYIENFNNNIIKNQPVWAFFIDFYTSFIYILFGYKSLRGYM